LCMIEHKISLVSIECIKPHERTVKSKVRKLLRDLLSTLTLRKPVVVDEETLTLLDGHHRLFALRRLGVGLVPAALVNYSDPRILVRRWGGGEAIEKRLVVERAMAGRLFPPKTTRHVVILGGREVHVSEVIPDINLNLKALLEYTVLCSELRAITVLGQVAPAVDLPGGATPAVPCNHRRGISSRERRRRAPSL